MFVVVQKKTTFSKILIGNLGFPKTGLSKRQIQILFDKPFFWIKYREIFIQNHLTIWLK